eukprot:4382601-Amphidinium_carterae.1
MPSSSMIGQLWRFSHSVACQINTYQEGWSTSEAVRSSCLTEALLAQVDSVKVPQLTARQETFELQNINFCTCAHVHVSATDLCLPSWLHAHTIRAGDWLGVHTVVSHWAFFSSLDVQDDLEFRTQQLTKVSSTCLWSRSRISVLLPLVSVMSTLAYARRKGDGRQTGDGKKN